jgi:hypothetical protein
MKKRSALHIMKGRARLIHGKGSRGGSLPVNDRSAGALIPDQYGQDDRLSWLEQQGEQSPGDDIHYGIVLHSAPPDIVDYFGHYFRPVEKAA